MLWRMLFFKVWFEDFIEVSINTIWEFIDKSFECIG